MATRDRRGIEMKALVLVMLLLTGCITTPFTKFSIGDCAKFNPLHLKEGQRTDRLTFYIRDITKTSYVVDFFHPKFGDITKLMLIEQFDEQWEEVDCTLADEIILDEIPNYNME